VADGRLYARSRELDALDAVTGRALWSVPIGGCGGLSFDEGTVYAVDADSRGRMVALDDRTGRPLWHRDLAGSCNGIVVSGGMGFLSGNNGRLHAVFLDRPDQNSTQRRTGPCSV
jgi:outer membrane protein assembly factor BamB